MASMLHLAGVPLAIMCGLGLLFAARPVGANDVRPLPFPAPVGVHGGDGGQVAY